MPDIDTPSLVEPKLQTPHALHLVHSATGTSLPQRLNHGHRRHVHACNSLAWQIFEAFGAAGHALHATEHTMRAVAADPVESYGSHAAASPQSSARMRFRQWISDRYMTWKREYRIRAMIAYYKHLPDWVLRDIGVERADISHIVRRDFSSGFES